MYLPDNRKKYAFVLTVQTAAEEACLQLNRASTVLRREKEMELQSGMKCAIMQELDNTYAYLLYEPCAAY